MITTPDVVPSYQVVEALVPIADSPRRLTPGGGSAAEQLPRKYNRFIIAAPLLPPNLAQLFGRFLLSSALVVLAGAFWNSAISHFSFLRTATMAACIKSE